jgi:hypothetical protein
MRGKSRYVTLSPLSHLTTSNNVFYALRSGFKIAGNKIGRK